MYKLLFVTYSFPPKGGPGVQRNLKLVKYLSQLGWNITVLTVKPLAATVTDTSLLEELPSTVSVVRTESLDPARIAFRLSRLRSSKSEFSKPTTPPVVGKRYGYDLYKKLQRWLLFPDSAVLWMPFAYHAGKRLLKSTDFDVVIGSCPGPSSLIIASWLAKASNAKLVYDFRDGWTDYPYRNLASSLHRKLDAILEKRYIGNADKLVTIGTYLVDLISTRYGIDAGQFRVIPNGYDADDFEGIEPLRHGSEELFRIAHTGNLAATRIEPFKTFLAALASIPATERTRLQVDLVGNIAPELDALIDHFKLRSNIHLWGYQPHAKSVSILLGADLLLILLPSYDTVAVTGKIFEYLATGLPVLSLANPLTECAKIVESLPDPSTNTSPTNVSECAIAIQSAMDTPMRKESSDGFKRFERRSQAAEYSNMLSQLIEDSR